MVKIGCFWAYKCLYNIVIWNQARNLLIPKDQIYTMPLIDSSLLSSIVPLVFSLAVVYGALHMSGVIKNKAANLLIALSIAFFAVSNKDAVSFINAVMPLAVPFFILFFFVGFIISFFKKQGAQKDYPLLVIIFGLVLLFLSSQTQLFSEDMLAAAGIVFMLLLIFAAYKSSGEK